MTALRETAAPTASGNGPFGIAIGMPLQKLKLGDMAGNDPFDRKVSPPSPDPQLDEYEVDGTDETGVCSIYASSQSNQNDGSGSAVRSEIDDFALALSSKYGQPKIIDRCTGDEVDCQSQFWMMALAQNERFYGRVWSQQNEAMKKAHIRQVAIFAHASDINTTQFALMFLGDNKEACDRATSRAKAKNL